MFVHADLPTTLHHTVYMDFLLDLHLYCSESCLDKHAEEQNVWGKNLLCNGVIQYSILVSTEIN